MSLLQPLNYKHVLAIKSVQMNAIGNIPKLEVLGFL